jgi:hypothetical protein
MGAVVGLSLCLMIGRVGLGRFLRNNSLKSSSFVAFWWLDTPFKITHKPLSRCDRHTMLGVYLSINPRL